MSFTSTPNLHSDPKVNLKDWQHGARMFSDQQFRLAPKFDFQYHVAFNINKAALKNANIVTRYGTEINMLIKGATLPKFDISIDTVNQYNRKKQIQYFHKPGDVVLTCYDDNMGLMNQLWQNYYSYYFADSTSAKATGAYGRTATQNSNYISTPFGLDNSSSNPFFNYITIYQMARHEWVSVKLINPIIKSWDGNKLAWDSTKTHEFTMTLAYEAVAYDAGAVEAGAPEGFGLDHYDVKPSPLTGINPDPTAINPSFVQALDIETAAPSFLNNTINTINAYQNTQRPLSAGGTAGVTTTVPLQTIGGVPGVVFPQASSTGNSTTVAKSITLGQ
jgi:hypothetical protein